MRVVAVLDSMWDGRPGQRQAPRSFRINPLNHSGKRLYRIVGQAADLEVTNACREVGETADHHGTPDPAWLRENLERLAPFDVLLVCGKVAQAAYERSGHEFEGTIRMPHPAARNWTHAALDATTEMVRATAARARPG